MIIDALTLFLVAFALLVIGGALLAFGLGAGALALLGWGWSAFLERQQRRIRIERRA